MKSLCVLVVSVIIALFLCVNSSAQPARDFQAETKKNAKMKDYILLVRFDTKKTLNPEQLKLLAEQWNALIERWKKQSNFVAASVIPQAGFVISGADRKMNKEFVVTANDFKVVSIIHLRADNIEKVVEFAKACPNLDLGGTVEVREIQPPADNLNVEKTKARQILIDKFTVSLNAKKEFLERMNVNLNFIKKLPGFVEDTVYEENKAEGEVQYVTVAVWENAEALDNAKKAVFAEFKKQNFDPAAMYRRLNIKIDRAVYGQTAAQKGDR